MELFIKDGKINFVDENDVVVGYDMRTQCCENFGWVLVYKLPDNDEIPADYKYLHTWDCNPYVNLANNIFDPDFFEKRLMIIDNHEGLVAIFRLQCKSDEKYEEFLILYNFYNGYYTHGFTLEVKGKLAQSDEI